MFKPVLFATLLSLAGLSTIDKPAAAQSFSAGYHRDHHDFVVHYSLAGREMKHMHSHRAAHELAGWLRSLGCRATVRHIGHHHYDVVYWCPRPRAVAFHHDGEAHRLEHKLARLGFDVHVHH